MSDNGSKRPFGPHGEGCDCGQHAPEPDSDAPETTEEPFQMPKMFVSVGFDDTDLNELMFIGISDAYAAHLGNVVEQCAFDGEPLSNRQISHIIGGMMRGHALAMESAKLIQHNYVRMVTMFQEQAAAQAAEDEPTEDGHGLRNISDLFQAKPPEEEAEETDGS